MLSKLCIIKRNFPKSRKGTHLTLTITPFNRKNLTRMNESLPYQRRKLKCSNLVNACYTRDGIVTIKINELSKAIKIHHMNDLLKLFPNFNFEDEPFHEASPDVSGQAMY